MAEDNKGIKDPMKSGKDFGSPFDIFKAKLNRNTVKNLKQPTGGLTSKKGKGVPDPKVKINRSTLKSLSANKLIGVQEINQYLKDKISVAECKELINIKTRQYAKRQNTWARGHMKNWNKLYSKNFSILLKKTLKVVS